MLEDDVANAANNLATIRAEHLLEIREECFAGQQWLVEVSEEGVRCWTSQPSPASAAAAAAFANLFPFLLLSSSQL